MFFGDKFFEFIITKFIWRTIFNKFIIKFFLLFISFLYSNLTECSIKKIIFCKKFHFELNTNSIKCFSVLSIRVFIINSLINSI